MIRGSSMSICKTSEEMKDIFIEDKIVNLKKSLSKWLRWIDNYPIDMDIRDRFTIEQHLGGWLANLQQFTDLLDAEYLQVCNCAAIISLLCSYTEKERKSKKEYQKLYQIIYPEVMKYPINPKDSLSIFRYYLNVVRKEPSRVIRRMLKK